MIPDPRRQALFARQHELESEIAQLEKARRELMGMSDEESAVLTFRYVKGCESRFPYYEVTRDGCGIAELSCKLGGLFHNDKYDSYTPQEMREMADFMAKLEVSLQGRGYVFTGVSTPPRLDLFAAGSVKEYHLYWKANLPVRLGEDERDAARAVGWDLTQNSHCHAESWMFGKVDWKKTLAAWNLADTQAANACSL